MTCWNKWWEMYYSLVKSCMELVLVLDTMWWLCVWRMMSSTSSSPEQHLSGHSLDFREPSGQIVSNKLKRSDLLSHGTEWEMMWEPTSINRLLWIGSMRPKVLHMDTTTSFMDGLILQRVTTHLFCQSTSFQSCSLSCKLMPQHLSTTSSHRLSTSVLEQQDLIFRD